MVAMNRYPFSGRVSMILGLSVLSSSATRILRIAVLTACSNSTNSPSFQSSRWISSRVTSCPGRFAERSQSRGLVLELNPAAGFVQLSGLEIQFKRLKANSTSAS